MTKKKKKKENEKIEKDEKNKNEERSLTMEKDAHYLFIICENHRFQNPVSFL